MATRADMTIDVVSPLPTAPERAEANGRFRYLSGVAFVALFAAGFAVGGTTPTVASSIAAVTTYYSDQRGRVLVAAVLFVWGIVFEILFGVAIGNRLRRDGQPWLGSVAIVAVAVLGTLQLLLTAAAALLSFAVAGQGDPAVVKAFFDLQWVLDVFAGAPSAAYFAAAAAGLLRTGAVPAWVGRAGIGVAGLWVLRTTTWASDGPWSPSGAFIAVAVFASLLWIVATSVLLLRREAHYRQ